MSREEVATCAIIAKQVLERLRSCDDTLTCEALSEYGLVMISHVLEHFEVTTNLND